LPAALKQVLVDEHEALKKGLRLPPVPRNPSVAEILLQYVEESRASGQVVDGEEQVPPPLSTHTPPPSLFPHCVHDIMKRHTTWGASDLHLTQCGRGHGCQAKGLRFESDFHLQYTAL
jgi:hypothetical protein